MPDTTPSNTASSGTASIPYFQKLENNQVIARSITEIVRFEIFEEFGLKLHATGIKIQWFKEVIRHLYHVFTPNSVFGSILKDKNFVDHILQFPSERFFLLEKHLRTQYYQVGEEDSDNNGQRPSLDRLIGMMNKEGLEFSLTGDRLYQCIDQAFELTKSGGMMGKNLLDGLKRKKSNVATAENVMGQLYCHCWYYQNARNVVINILKQVDYDPSEHELHRMLMQVMRFPEKDILEGIDVILEKILLFKKTSPTSISTEQLVETTELMRIYFSYTEFEKCLDKKYFVHLSFSVLRKIFLILDDFNGKIHQLGLKWKLITDEGENRESNPYLTHPELSWCFRYLHCHASKRLREEQVSQKPSQPTDRASINWAKNTKSKEVPRPRNLKELTELSDAGFQLLSKERRLEQELFSSIRDKIASNEDLSPRERFLYKMMRRQLNSAVKNALKKKSKGKDKPSSAITSSPSQSNPSNTATSGLSHLSGNSEFWTGRTYRINTVMTDDDIKRSDKWILQGEGSEIDISPHLHHFISLHKVPAIRLVDVFGRSAVLDRVGELKLGQVNGNAITMKGVYYYPEAKRTIVNLRRYPNSVTMVYKDRYLCPIHAETGRFFQTCMNNGVVYVNFNA
ncbi:hypothetical protein TRVA0_056S00122 [Trichomonascus vanleenenianus]|uniref:uncharacterized protein n=1 Tax=Trichomonascus vanleenenianus TaxID=2268995 RepID=UPI003ECA60A7